MAGDDQERFEDYLELERYIEELQAGNAAPLPQGLTPEKARIFRMAALFRSASSEEVTPRPEFVAELQAKLEQEAQMQQPTQKTPVPSPAAQPPQKNATPSAAKRQRVSRRTLIASGAAVAAAAASFAVGAGIDHAMEEQAFAAASNWQTPLVPSDTAATWHFVTTLAELGDQAVRFTTDTVVGYLIRNDDDTSASSTGNVVAFSAACTHMGCVVQWESSDRKYHCPCHGGVFSEYGLPDNQNSWGVRYLRALPRFDVRIDSDGKIYVRVPVKSAS